jgi:hypothetical protein
MRVRTVKKIIFSFNCVLAGILNCVPKNGTQKMAGNPHMVFVK